jgi:hypothetical protein
MAQPDLGGAMHRRAIVVVALTCVSLSVLAILPLPAAGLGKQIIQNMIMSDVKGHLIGALARQVCKGARLIKRAALTRSAASRRLPGIGNHSMHLQDGGVDDACGRSQLHIP